MNSLFPRFTSCLGALLVCVNVVAQENNQAAPLKSSSCKRENALAIVEQQIDFSKTIDDDVARITVLVRAADLIWPFAEKQARNAFAEAFELAVRNFKEKGAEPVREGMVSIDTPDQRYKVITAISRRDVAWGKKLTERMLKEQQDESDSAAGRDAAGKVKTAE